MKQLFFGKVTWILVKQITKKYACCSACRTERELKPGGIPLEPKSLQKEKVGNSRDTKGSLH